MNISDVKFAKSGDVHLAYQRYGAGPDVVLVPPLVSNVELGWEQEVYRRAREHVGRYVNVLDFDKRGIGSSDRFTQPPTLEERIGDITAVMEAEGIERASLLGFSEGGLMSQLFAAMHPERVDRLVLVNSGFGLSAVPELRAYSDEPIDPLQELEERLARLGHVAETWGRDPQALVDLFCPSQSGNPAFVRWAGRFQRQTASPADFQRQLESIVTLDANDRLADIKAPTLVMNVTGDRLIHPVSGRYLADEIPGARFVEFAGEDHLCWIMPNWREVMDCWVEFVTGAAPAARRERRFATVLFTDIVGSTAEAARVGDAALANDHGGARSSRLAYRRRAQRQARQKHRRRAAGDVRQPFGSDHLYVQAHPRAGWYRPHHSRGTACRREIEVREDGDVTGLAVNLAARVEQAARDGATDVSSTVRELLIGGEHAFEDRGEHELKGIPGAWRLYELAA
jgi:pimeloyl-ACP methyl ester carboxylesterase/class 3 adenylate cyclase